MTNEKNPLELDFFKENGFTRKQCRNCGHYFWTTDDARETCGDPPCDEYSFIHNTPVRRQYTLDEMRDAFISFFSDTHTFMKPYPVVPRWRDDVLLVNASIYDFQPHVTSGIVPPPANPIVMSQPSIRMTDVDLVGSTGRHLTTFEMMCHDAFNYGDKEIYWMEGTISYCNSFLTEELGVSQDFITYKEKPWSGGGNGGNAVEVLILGLEVATLVFMDKELDPDGETVIDGLRYSPMGMKVVDTGYGLERLTWLSRGSPTVYEAIYPEILQHILARSSSRIINEEILEMVVQNFARGEGKTENEILRASFKKAAEMNPDLSEQEFIEEFHAMKSAFIIADHARTLLLLFSDFVIPSNIKAGYIVRLLIRRTLRNMEAISFKGSIKELIAMHWESLRNIITNYPEGFIDLMLEEETRKYSETLEKGRGIVERILEKKSGLGREQLITLYDSYGLHPEFVASIVMEKTGKELEIPDDFHAQVISIHEEGEKQKKYKEQFPVINTRPLYYDDVKISDFNAIVLHSGKDYIITNQTAFYPEGGGQPTDLGTFTYKGKEIEVKKVERYGDTIVHWINGTIPKGSRIMGHIDTFRRKRLMAHHSATHLILGVLKQILGPHVWQFGVQKGVETSRIDVTHYGRITEEDVRRIEQRCLDYVREGRNIRVKNMDWNRAIEKYGFTVFQGGVPLSGKLRIVEIEGVDVEGCGGTHLSSTSELGIVKIISVESIQEGIQRITFVAADAALAYIQKMDSSMKSVQSMIGSDQEQLAGRIQALVRENIQLNKEKDAFLKKAVNSAIDSATIMEYKWGEAAILWVELDTEGMKLLTKALFSRSFALSVTVNEPRPGEFIYTIISKGNLDSIQVAKSLLKEYTVTNSSSNYFSAISGEKVDEKLIREVFDRL